MPNTFKGSERHLMPHGHPMKKTSNVAFASESGSFVYDSAAS